MKYNNKLKDISISKQEFTSEKTSINSSKLPALFNMIKFEPHTINLDYGGGKFDNVAEFLSKQNVVNLVYDPYNRTAEHNDEVLQIIKMNNGADTVSCSNVLNVIKEESVRKEVIENIYELLKSGGTAYFTVYEGDKTSEARETKSGYQLNAPTKSYLEIIKSVFGNAEQHGKLIIAKK